MQYYEINRLSSTLFGSSYNMSSLFSATLGFPKYGEGEFIFLSSHTTEGELNEKFIEEIS